MTLRVAYLGPQGTFSEEAAAKHAPGAELVPYPSFPHVGDAIEDGQVDEAVVPIENSVQGSIVEIVDFLLSAERARIKGELLLKVELCLMARPGVAADDIEVIYSHPQPLGQSRRYLAANFPDVEQMAVLSTAAAAVELGKSTRPAAALAQRRLAEMYGLNVLAQDVQDRKNNVTRFVILGAEDHPRTGRDKTSIAFEFARGDVPGLVYAALKPFADRDINLTKIESRPTGDQLGLYVFLLDFDGHREDAPVREALGELSRHTSRFKVLGSYPRADRPL